jgi:thiol-disulfide isomerase/thioredoxin
MISIFVEKIGKLTELLYIAEYQRMVRKSQFDTQRKDYPCKAVEYEYYDPQTGDGASFCWRSLNQLEFKDWCPNCKYTQPYYEAFCKSDKVANNRRRNLRRVLKRKIERIIHRRDEKNENDIR